MANEEQLAILRQGVEVWNKWRVENSNIEIELSGANLYKANLTAANLTAPPLCPESKRTITSYGDRPSL